MNAPINDGGPAFPFPIPTFDTTGKQIGHSTECPGMSLRDWFAGMALRGIMDTWERPITDEEFASGIKLPLKENVAKVCYEFSDAMLKERSKK